MLVRLNLSREDRWTTLFEGFDVLHGPITSAILREAAFRAGEQFSEESIESAVKRSEFITQFVGQMIIRDWRGPVDWDTNEPIKVTPDAIERTLEIPEVFRAFNTFVLDSSSRVAREKKSFPTSQPTTSGSVQDTAATAKKPARRARRGR